MKKTYFNPAIMRKVYAPKIGASRFKYLMSTATRAYKDEGAEGSEGDKRTEAELLVAIDTRISKALENRATKEELKAIQDSRKEELKGLEIEALRAMADDKTGAMATLAKQGLEITRLTNSISKQPKDMSIRAQCQAFLDDKEKVDAIRSGKKVEFELNVRAAATSPMLPSTVMPGGTQFITRYEVAPGINELLRPEPTFWDTIKKGNTNAETYIWLNKQPTDGAAGWIGPGEYKPAISFTVDTENSHAKKIAVNEKMAIELLDDIDGFESWVTTELNYQLMQKVNDILQGAGAGDTKTPEGLQHMSIPYNSLVGFATTSPTFWDASLAVVTMLRTTRFRGPIVLFVNPVDYANGLATKSISQGQLFIPPAIGGTFVQDLNMPLGYIQGVATDYYKLLIYKGFMMQWGLENDDFTKNLRTVIGEMRLHQFHSANYNGFAIYDSIATIKGEITTAP